MKKVPCRYIKGESCPKFLVPPLINTIENSLSSEEADELIATYEDAARFKWLLEHPQQASVLRYQKRAHLREWIDGQRRRDP